jgi:hypothetical protein
MNQSQWTALQGWCGFRDRSSAVVWDIDDGATAGMFGLVRGEDHVDSSYLSAGFGSGVAIVRVFQWKSPQRWGSP